MTTDLTRTHTSANNYQDEESEIWIGEWMEKHGVRDEIVLATKYTMGFRTYTKKGIHSNQAGNNAKSMRISVDASLKKLKTDYIDVVSSIFPLFAITRRASNVVAFTASWDES